MHLPTPEEMHLFGLDFSKKLTDGQIVALFGPLGAGKTTLVQAMVAGLLGKNAPPVSSPTFVYLNVYENADQAPIYHFDLYRLKNSREFIACGFEEYLNSGSLCIIEWAERIEDLLPPQAIKLHIDYAENKGRTVRATNL